MAQRVRAQRCGTPILMLTARASLEDRIRGSQALLIPRQRLGVIAQPDPHAQGGRYLVRSLYFDTPEDRALLEKLNGVSRREKFRIRLYNGDPDTLHLEKKYKQAGLG